MDYARTVKRIGNSDDIVKVDLHDILPSATVMVVVVTGTTTEGRQLTESEWKACEEACDLALELEKAKHTVSHASIRTHDPLMYHILSLSS